MSILLADIAFSTAQALLLIAVCFGSLILALYCAIFMVPVKRFMARIHSLGGGMKGLEGHINGLKSETDKRIAAAQDLVLGLCTEVAEIQGELERLRTDVANERAEVEEVNRRLDAVTKGLAAVQTEFGALPTELRENVRQQVSDSYHRMESMMLGALEALQDEMLRETRGRRTARVQSRAGGTGPPGRIPERRRGATSSKIIPAPSLFGGLEKEQTQPEAEIPAQDGSETPRETVPAK